ncbi:ribonuclease H-like domain-containing protein [Tanacetum coccineum]
MRTKPGVDTLSFDDPYNNLRVFESDIKGSTTSSSSTQNVAFVSSESTSSTNNVSTAYGVSTSSGHNSQKKNFIHTLMKLSTLRRIDMVSAMNFYEIKRSFTRRQEKSYNLMPRNNLLWTRPQVECFKCHNTGHFARECISKGNQESRRSDEWNSGYKAKDNRQRPGKQEEPKALVTLDGDSVDWTSHAEDEKMNFALMAHNKSGSNTENRDRHCAYRPVASIGGRSLEPTAIMLLCI